ncbi:MAG: hypothetical protein Kow002_16510 [Anaerolineales bacterium]
MDALDSFFAILTAFGLRFALPIGITALFIYLLRKLDARWQAEGQLVSTETAVEKPKCWKANNCSTEDMEKCPGYQTAQPCWQAFRTQNGHLKEECLGCGVFRKAPIPTHH